MGHGAYRRWDAFHFLTCLDLNNFTEKICPCALTRKEAQLIVLRHFLLIYLLKLWFCVWLLQGNIDHSDHFCWGNIMLMDGDVLGCIIITIVSVFHHTIYYYSKEIDIGTFYSHKELERAV